MAEGPQPWLISSPSSSRRLIDPTRSTFAANLFQAGGIEPATEGRFEDSGATEAVLCSSDGRYAEQAAESAGSQATASAR